ncbi:MAG: DNA recombination protein RmuC [Alphaproteobacteria bacterium]
MDWGWIGALAFIGITAFLIGTKRSRKETLDWQNKHQVALIEIAKLQTKIDSQEQVYKEKVEVLTNLRGEIQKDFENIASRALNNNQNAFLNLANENFRTHKEGAKAELEERKKAVEALVTPINESLKAYKKQIEDIEKDRATSQGALTNELKTLMETQNAVRNETSKLVNALRGAPKTRGRWGEHTLQHVLELAGLSEHCDFDTEKTFKRNDESLRPDVAINLPGGRKLFIDSKTSLSAYLDAVEAVDEEERNRHLILHAQHIRNHVKQLSSKEYWDNLTSTPDFVVMFIPGDNFYTAAVERDPNLFVDAAAKHVIIVTPATLIALAKAIAYGWRQESIADNAKKIHDAGRELYKRLATMSEHIITCGRSIGKSVESYNKLIGSLESKVMPQARKFNELKVEGTATEIENLEPIDQETRSLQSSDFIDQENKVLIKAL